MQIKKLQLVGFKTFADKTEIDFAHGLTAVVGPNGCGKSNIADALLWVMGGHNPRLLRGSDGRDLIFAGTDRRKPLGMAEVRLTLDNTDHILPLDFAEITITRRLFRSGESQFFLNNVPCRLKDIVELFLDTGLGKGAYSFVSQNEIDAVLSAHPEDRRELFEEAAGIKKYRLKKREAVRKLEQVDANLNRVHDILYEIEQQRTPLAKQAETARQYLRLTERLREIEVGLLMAEAQKVDYALYAARSEHNLNREALEGLNAELTRLEKETEAAGAYLVKTEQELEQARLAYQAAVSSVERIESRLQIVSERGKAVERIMASLDVERHALAERARNLEKEIEAQIGALEKAEATESSRRKTLSAANADLQKQEEALAEAMRCAEDRQAALRQLAEERVKREAALEAARRQLTECEAEIARLQGQATQLEIELPIARKRVQTLSEHLIELQQEHEALKVRQAQCATERQFAKEEEARARTALDSARRLLTERSSRLSALQEMLEAGEGYYQGVRAVLEAARKKALAGHYTPVVELLIVPEAYRVAIEVALGAAVQDIVCDTEEEAKAAITWLKKHRAGRATFLALPLLRPPSSLPSEMLKTLDGIIGLAAEQVRVEAKYAPVVQLLLGRVVVAEEMDSAIRAARRLHGWSRIVTCEGEVLTPGGALTGGSLQGRGSHLIERKGEIDDLKQVLPSLQAGVEERVRQLESASLHLRELDSAEEEVKRNLAKIHTQMVTCEHDLHAARQEEARLEKRRREIWDQITRCRALHDSLLAEVAEREAAWVASRAEDTRLDEEAAAAKVEIDTMVARRDQAREMVVALEIETGKLAEKLAGLRRSIAANREALRQLHLAQAGKEAQRDQVAGEWKEADSLRRELERKREEAHAHREWCEQKLSEVQTQRQRLQDEQSQKMAAMKERSDLRAQLIQQMHDAELTIARLEVRLNQLAQRLQDDYDIALEQALVSEITVDVDRATVNEVARLRREIHAMGAVNTGAVEEYERLTDRHRFLATQCADLERARESLLATVAEIDKSTRSTFMETFHAVAKEFDRLFARLFGGGTTRLLLTNPNDLLETGVEVIVQPPGKKAQNLLLLSGGERVLTAIALLFSFLAVRPSPFVLLDEVDAPLDGANVERFVALVREFTQQTQFLIITHNPTTIEAATHWYGVTMPEPGVSRVLSFRVPEEAHEMDSDVAVVLQRS